MDASVPYSARMRGTLVVGEQNFSLGQLSSHFCIVRSPTHLPPGPAEIVVEIEGVETRRQVYLFEGMSPESPTVPYARK